jgi:hypothetical protein
MFKNLDGQNLAELRNFKLVKGQLFNINGKNHYRGANPYPVTPNIGDTWEEFDISNNLIGQWVYQPFGWLSDQVFTWSRRQDAPLSGFSAIANNWEYAIDPRSNLFLKQAILSVKTNVSSGATTPRWDWIIERLNAPNTLTTIGTFGTSAGISGLVETTLAIPINIGVITNGATAAKRIRVREAVTGSITKLSSYELQYQKMRF